MMDNDVKDVMISVNGHKTSYKTTGRGDQKILLLPGGIGNLETDMWITLTTLNKELFTIYGWVPQAFISENGHSHFDSRRLYQKDADFVADFITAARLEGCSVIGLCYGGALALILAAKYPKLVSHIIVFGAKSFLTQYDRNLMEFIKDSKNWRPEFLEPHLPFHGAEALPTFIHNKLDCSLRYFKENDWDICKNDLPKIQCPTLIIHGVRDPVVDPIQPQYMKEHIPNSTLHLIPEGSHDVNNKHCKEFNQVVETFILSSPPHTAEIHQDPQGYKGGFNQEIHSVN